MRCHKPHGRTDGAQEDAEDDAKYDGGADDDVSRCGVTPQLPEFNNDLFEPETSETWQSDVHATYDNMNQESRHDSGMSEDVSNLPGFTISQGEREELRQRYTAMFREAVKGHPADEAAVEAAIENAQNHVSGVDDDVSFDKLCELSHMLAAQLERLRNTLEAREQHRVQSSTPERRLRSFSCEF